MSDFIYYGHFYKQIIGHVRYCCRSTLEIIRPCSQTLVRAVARSPRVLLDHQPDAVFIMLNPGNSRPCDGQVPRNRISPCRINDHARHHLVPTCPDDTQDKIEIVMTRKQFNHVRVLNLFDIRERESTELVGRIRNSLGLRERQHTPNPPNILSYSIFSRERRRELIGRLNARNRSMVVAAWTTNKALKSFFIQCYRILNGDLHLRIHGLSNQDVHHYRGFYHPLMKKDWAIDIVNSWPDEQDTHDGDR